MQKRIQRRRTKGFKLAEQSDRPIKYVGRPSRWANPYRMTKWNTREEIIEYYRKYLASLPRERLIELLRPLRGHDLACWCPLTDAEGNPVPCHADVLLQYLHEFEQSGAFGIDNVFST